MIRVGDRVRVELRKGSWGKAWQKVIARWTKDRRTALKAGRRVPPQPRSKSAEGKVIAIWKAGGAEIDCVNPASVWHARIVIDFGWGIRGVAVGRAMAEPALPEVVG